MGRTVPATRTLLSALALAGAIVLAYAATLRGEFLWDDDAHISANPTVVGPLGLKEIWTTARANYFPLVLTNFRLQHALWGLNPVGYRAVTLAFHVLAALLLWRVLMRLHVPGAWLGAAFWSLHPVQVESVAWVCELKNTQSAVFFLLTIWFWIRWLEAGQAADAPGSRPKTGSTYALALACAALALLSKPSTVMLPVALGLCLWWMRRRLTGRDLAALAPFTALSCIVAGWTIWEQKFHSGASGAEWAQTWPERVTTAGRIAWFYLGKLAWPEPLMFIYPRWTPDAGNAAAFLPAAGVLVGLGWLAWRRHRLRGGFFAAAYFVALLFPVLGFFDVYFFRYSFVGDHFQYLASMGPVAALVAAVATVMPRGGLVAGAAVVALALGTRHYAATFRDSETLWRTTVARNPGSAMAWAQLGAVQVRAARHDDAIASFQRALQINPQHPEALNHLGCEYLRLGRMREGIAQLRQAIAARPDFAEALSNLGLALAQDDRASEALPLLETAVRLRPDAAAPHAAMARALAALGRTDEAMAHFETALRLDPNRAQTHDDFGLALAAAGRADEAIARYERALQLQPELASAHNNLGVALAQRGQLPDALAHFDAAVRIDPAYTAAHLNRGGALVAMQRLPEAGAAFARAVQLQPDSEKAQAYLGQVLQALGRETEAREHLELAERLGRDAARGR